MAKPIVYLKGDATDGSGDVSSRRRGDAGYRFDCLPAGRYTLWISHTFRIRQEVILKANEEFRVDFDYATGSGSIQGTVNVPGNDKESDTIGVYLFKPGTCPWQEGQAFKEVSFDEGLVTTLLVRKGNISQGQLPAGTFDVVAVLQQDGLILKLDIRRVTLGDGESETINLDVAK